MVFGPEVEVVKSSQDRNVVLDILVLPELVQTSVLATQQIDDHLVALLPSERTVDNQDCSKLQCPLIDVGDIQPLLHSGFDFQSIFVQFATGQRHGVRENSAVLINSNVVRYLLEGQPILGLVLPNNNQNDFVLPGHVGLQRSDVEYDLVRSDGHIEFEQLVELVSFSLLRLGDIVGDQDIWDIVTSQSVECFRRSRNFLM